MWDVDTNTMAAKAPVAMTAKELDATRKARSLYVGNLPFVASPDMVTNFLNEKLQQAGLTKWPGPPINSSNAHNAEGRFLFVELRDIDETTALLMFDGVVFMERQLRIRRPSGYAEPTNALSGVDPVANPNLFAALNGQAKIQGVVAADVQDGPNKVWLGNLPHHLSFADVKGLVEMFGELKAFYLLTDNTVLSLESHSKGSCFLEYVDPNVTDQAIAGLHGLEICGRELVCRRSHQGQQLGQPLAPLADLSQPPPPFPPQHMPMLG